MDNSEDEDAKIMAKVSETKAKLKASGDKSKSTWNIIKILVSKKKERYVSEGFDLDLSFILPNLIAMGYPAQGFESYYRNSMEEVRSFFNKKFFSHYKIYNLCSEKRYGDTEFKNCDQTFTFDDHNPPMFITLVDFCKNLASFLDESPQNVAGIHCKAGKGRTGVMISCYLVYNQFCKTAHEALVYYGKIRTKNAKGVTIPS